MGGTELLGLRQLLERLRPPLLPPPVRPRRRRAEVVGGRRRPVPRRTVFRYQSFYEEEIVNFIIRPLQTMEKL